MVVSCVEEKSPYRAHPHNLVGKGGIFNKGVYSVNITNPDMTCQVRFISIKSKVEYLTLLSGMVNSFAKHNFFSSHIARDGL